VDVLDQSGPGRCAVGLPGHGLTGVLGHLQEQVISDRGQMAEKRVVVAEDTAFDFDGAGRGAVRRPEVIAVVFVGV
jgi:hypothetical protein